MFVRYTRIINIAPSKLHLPVFACCTYTCFYPVSYFCRRSLYRHGKKNIPSKQARKRERVFDVWLYNIKYTRT